MATSDQEGVPVELVDSFQSFDSALSRVESVMKPLTETPRNEMLKKFTPLEMAKLDLVSAYSINSLFWMYLITQGINPRKHEIKSELDRIKSYMTKIKVLEDKKNAPKLQTEAAKRFVRNAMFDLKGKNRQRQENADNETESEILQRPVAMPDDIGDQDEKGKDNKDGSGTSVEAAPEEKAGLKRPNKLTKRKGSHGHKSHKKPKKAHKGE